VEKMLPFFRLLRFLGIYLYQNNLVGEIPPGLGRLTILIEIKLFLNRLIDTLPENLCRNSELQALDIAEKQLSKSNYHLTLR
jgi:hypothetical protein